MPPLVYIFNFYHASGFTHVSGNIKIDTQYGPGSSLSFFVTDTPRILLRRMLCVFTRLSPNAPSANCLNIRNPLKIVKGVVIVAFSLGCQGAVIFFGGRLQKTNVSISGPYAGVGGTQLSTKNSIDDAVRHTNTGISVLRFVAETVPFPLNRRTKSPVRGSLKLF